VGLRVAASLINGFLIGGAGFYFPGFVIAAARVLGAGSYLFIVGELCPPGKGNFKIAAVFTRYSPAIHALNQIWIVRSM
jgi:hypothetical protein